MKGMQTAVAAVAAAATIGISGLAQTSAPPAAASAPKTWADKLTFKGDLRYRYESIQDDSKLDDGGDTYTRQRNRIRARLGAEAKIDDQMKAGLELSTGQSDPVSGNQSLGDGFGKKEFRLNLAYADYNLLRDGPHAAHAIGGKMKNPFITLPDDLVWDGDLTPEGLAFKGKLDGGFVTLLANGGYLWVQERSAEDDAMLYAGQAAAEFQLKPELGLTLGAAYYGFEHFKGYDVIDWEKKNNAYGNSTVAGSVSGGATNKAWASDFAPLVFFARLDARAFGQPIALFTQQLSNDDADSLGDGHLYGFSLGKAKNPRTWEVGYSYAELEKDATPGLMTDSDRWGGGSDGKGHRVYGKVQVLSYLQAGVTYLMGEKAISDSAKTKDYDRLQVDLVASF